MKALLTLICAGLLVVMLAVTVRASLQRNVLEAGQGLWPDPWFQATLADAYVGFVIFYLWVGFREPGGAARVVWFLLIMGLGNIATSVYVLIQLRRLQPGESVHTILARSGVIGFRLMFSVSYYATSA